MYCDSPPPPLSEAIADFDTAQVSYVWYSLPSRSFPNGDIVELGIAWRPAGSGDWSEQRLDLDSSVYDGYFSPPLAAANQVFDYRLWLIDRAGLQSAERFRSNDPSAVRFRVFYANSDQDLVPDYRWTPPVDYAEYAAGDSVMVFDPGDTSALGYLFDGWDWYLDGEEQGVLYPGDSFEMPDADVYLMARWQAYSYRVTFSIITGEPYYTTYVESPATSVSEWPSDPERQHYRFAGWYRAGQEFTADTAVTSDIDVMAGWEAVEYDISYVLNDGINNDGNPDKYSIESPVFLQDAYRDSYSFGGWYLDASFIGNQIDVIPEDLPDSHPGNITLYAKWQAMDIGKISLLYALPGPGINEVTLHWVSVGAVDSILVEYSGMSDGLWVSDLSSGYEIIYSLTDAMVYDFTLIPYSSGAPGEGATIRAVPGGSYSLYVTGTENANTSLHYVPLYFKENDPLISSTTGSDLVVSNFVADNASLQPAGNGNGLWVAAGREDPVNPTGIIWYQGLDGVSGSFSGSGIWHDPGEQNLLEMVSDPVNNIAYSVSRINSFHTLNSWSVVSDPPQNIQGVYSLNLSDYQGGLCFVPSSTGTEAGDLYLATGQRIMRYEVYAYGSISEPLNPVIMNDIHSVYQIEARDDRLFVLYSTSVSHIGYNRYLVVYDLSGNTVLVEQELTANYDSMLVSADGKSIYLTGDGLSLLSVYGYDGSGQLSLLPGETFYNPLVSPVMTMDQHGTLLILGTGKEISFFAPTADGGIKNLGSLNSGMESIKDIYAQRFFY